VKDTKVCICHVSPGTDVMMFRQKQMANKLLETNQNNEKNYNDIGF
jgi:hypothetical protein